MILSNSDATYLDCGYAGWVTDGNNWCSPYKGWQGGHLPIQNHDRKWETIQKFFQDLYSNNPYDIMRKHGIDEEHWTNILGGETAIWTEQTSDGDVLTKVKKLFV